LRSSQDSLRRNTERIGNTIKERKHGGNIYSLCDGWTTRLWAGLLNSDGIPFQHWRNLSRESPATEAVLLFV
jgi:hypothetical protein